MSIYKFKGDTNPKIKSKIDDAVLKFMPNEDDLSDPDEFESFIKSCETCVRRDQRYANYISALRERGFDKDVFQSGINNRAFESVTLEMHHGPLFTLYDICSIVVDHLLKEDIKFTTFDIANRVLDEHEANHIMVVAMLTKTNHQAVHEGKMFVHINQTFGDILQFLKTYKKGLRKDHLYTLEEYFKLCKKYNATDNDYLTLRAITDKIDKYMG